MGSQDKTPAGIGLLFDTNVQTSVRNKGAKPVRPFNNADPILVQNVQKPSRLDILLVAQAVQIHMKNGYVAYIFMLEGKRGA